MARFLRPGLCFASLAALTLLAVLIHERQANRRPERRFQGWDIPQLSAHLQRRGMDVQLRTVPERGPLLYSAYLTSTAKQWRDLNRLSKDPRRIAEWRGTLYCELVGDNDAGHLLEQWGEHGLQIGPFVFYGDAELLHLVRTALDTPPPVTP